MDDKVIEFKNKLEESKANEEKQFKDIFDELMAINKDDEIFGEMVALLGLEEDAFSVIAPAVLEELERSYNDPSTIISTSRALNAGGIRLEDVKKSIDELDSIILEAVKNGLSMQKADFVRNMCQIIYNGLENCVNVSRRIVSIPISYCRDGVKTPTYAHETDAGLDIYALEDVTIAPGETKLIPTGIKVAIPSGYELQVRPKSGRCLKTKLRVANTPGTIDSGYRDEIGVIIENVDPPIKNIDSEPIFDSEGKLDGFKIKGIEYGSSYTIGKGEKFAQLVLNEISKVSFHEIDDVSNISNDGRNGGYGSSGLK